MITRKLLAASLNFPDLMSDWAALISCDPGSDAGFVVFISVVFVSVVFVSSDGCDRCGSAAGAVTWPIAVPTSNARLSDSRNAVTPRERMQSDYMHSPGMIWLVIRVPV
jgi:hypothetical protein